MGFTKKKYIFVSALTFCTILFIMFPLAIHAQTVDLPDVNLRAAITAVLGKTPGGAITAEEMATLTRLEVHNANIRDLTGLAFATKLEEIRCNNNLISDLSPLTDLVNLRVIELRDNVISDLSPIAGLINLEWLVVPHNSIRDLSPVEALINLIGLAVEDNLISDLSPISGLIKLERIWLHENPPMALSPLEGLISLRAIRSWGTPIISDLSTLAKLPKLQVIDICGGDLSDLSALEGMTGLKELYLVGNEITDISPLASLTGLTRLSLKHNQVLDVSPLAGLGSLTFIDLEDNEILDFSPIDALPENVHIVRHNNPGFTPAAPKIEGPWLWVIAPTDGMSGSKAAASGSDFLSKTSSGEVTESAIATRGAVAGEPVGNKVWTVGKLSRRGGNNINDMVNATALGAGDINHHVAYGSIAVESLSQQHTRMFVGSGDAVKVWLNGVLVHSESVDRDADNYQEDFPVTLEEGTNILLVAVYEGEGWWSGFFGFDVSAEFTVNLPGPPILVDRPRVADINGDGKVSILDLILVARDFGKIKLINPGTDVNGDGKVNISDLIAVAQSMDAEAGNAAPSAVTMNGAISPAVIQAWIAQARIENDGSLVFQNGIANLQRLLAALIPERTALLVNYPNPFNPETWIPYQLARVSDVQIHIYAASGILVRTLDLGHRPAGIYQQRTRAAHWDGRNQLGEPVASGVYFYTLTAGDFTATRKMLIAK
ncbi:MAG: T9SS type A sorting domain-containing protein [Candidatus Poribacteria bacterium]|nr:T9SS type A sorting domain-containing protein [Candidatus Poribacteria bacterium]